MSSFELTERSNFKLFVSSIWYALQFGPVRFLASLLAVLIVLSPRPANAQESLDFEVTPRRICDGETVSVSWAEAEDRGVLITEPRIKGPRHVAEAGSRQPVLRDSTLFRMLAISNGDTTRSVQEVAIFHDGQRKPLVFALHPVGDSALAASDTLRSDVWSSNVRIGTLRTRAGRPVTVTHAGTKVVLSADSTPSAAFRGLPVGGVWKVQAPVLPDEKLGDPENAPPPRLQLTVTILCSR